MDRVFDIADYIVSLRWRDGRFILVENGQERRISIKSAESWFEKHFSQYSWRKTLREIERFKKKEVRRDEKVRSSRKYF